MLRRCGPPPALAGVLAALALAAAACSGDGENGSGSGSPSVASSAAESTTSDFSRVNEEQTGTVRLVDESWVCRGQVDMDLVKVEIRTIDRDAVYLRQECTGRIGRIEIDTWMGDGVKVNAPAPAAHDLVIEGGYIRCHDQGPGGHQDGVQVMGGERISFRGIEIECGSGPNAQFYVSALAPGLPTEVVCEGCFLGSGAASTFFVDRSVRSGARNTLICPGRFHTVRIDETLAEDPVSEGNRILPENDPRCAA